MPYMTYLSFNPILSKVIDCRYLSIYLVNVIFVRPQYLHNVKSNVDLTSRSWV